VVLAVNPGGRYFKLSFRILQFGVQSVRVKRQSPLRLARINEEVASAYPVIHERTLGLYLQYLEHKCHWGE